MRRIGRLAIKLIDMEPCIPVCHIVTMLTQVETDVILRIRSIVVRLSRIFSLSITGL